MLVTLLEPLLKSAFDVLYHSVQKRANFDPATLSAKRDIARGPRTFLSVFFFFRARKHSPRRARAEIH